LVGCSLLAPYRNTLPALVLEALPTSLRKLPNGWKPFFNQNITDLKYMFYDLSDLLGSSIFDLSGREMKDVPGTRKVVL
jgi:hypothetical protein